MIWWLKVRRAHLVLPGSLLVYAVLLMALNGRSFMMPTWSASTVQTRLTLFVPLVVTIGLALCMESRLAAPEVSGVRSVNRLDICMSAVSTLGALLLGALLSFLADSPEFATAGRNSAFLSGLFLVAWPALREAAALIPAAWILVVMLAGYRSPLDAYPWTIIPEPVDRPHAWTVAFLAFLAGIFVQGRTMQKESL
ncbi:hypothetical protein [Streptomyces massasporeus]|uniref:hypothetical protein n=1 Tax=Streptomyces massasporeus TaxID=67324 RepID=UPI003326CEF2